MAEIENVQIPVFHQGQAERIERAVRDAQDCGVPMSRITPQAVILGGTMAQILSTPGGDDVQGDTDQAINAFVEVMQAFCESEEQAQGKLSPIHRAAIVGGVAGLAGAAVGATTGYSLAPKKDRTAAAVAGGFLGLVIIGASGFGVSHAFSDEEERKRLEK